MGLSELLVFAAASTAAPMTELAELYQARAGTKVVLSFGASNDLARQLSAGARADAFISADIAQVRRAGLEGRMVRLLSNTLVVVVGSTAKTDVRSPADLTRVKRLALADPAGVPLGIYARAWLQAAGLWDALAPKVVAALDARAALAAVESGNVEAGIVYRTDAALSKRVKIAFAVEGGPEIVYPAAWRTPAGERFVKFLQSDEALKVFERHGFLRAR